MFRPSLCALLALTSAASAPAQATWSKLLPAARKGLGVSEFVGGDLLLASRGVGLKWLVTRVDALGAPIWNLEFDDKISGVRSLSTGGFVSFGQVDTTWPPEAWVTGYDALGKKQWGWHIDDTVVTIAQFEEVIETADGGLALIGTTCTEGSSYGFQEMMVIRTNPDGSIRWFQAIWEDQVQETSGSGHDIVELPDGSLLASGRAGVDPLLVRLDGGTGSILWHEQIDVPVFSFRTEVEINANNQIYVLSWPTLFEIDATGMVLWGRNLNSSSGFSSSLTLAADGGPVVAGHFKKNARIVKFTPAGELVWDRLLPGPGIEDLQEIRTTTSGQFAAFGHTWAQPIDLTISQAWAIQLDDEGRAAGCLETPSTPVTIDELTNTVIFVNTDIDTSNAARVIIHQSPDAVLSNTPVDSTCWSGLGSNYCSPAFPHSGGSSARITAHGSTLVSDEDFLLAGTSLPKKKFGYFLAGLGNAQVNPPGAQGTLCLAGTSIHRFSKHIASTGETGEFSLLVDVTAIPGKGAVQPGETWNFQAWFRDNNPGPTSNFSDAVSVTFQ